MERQDAVTMKGNPLTLAGSPIEEGAKAPDFVVVNGELEDVRGSDFSGKIVVACSVPSLDTPVCDREMRRFNEEATKLSDDVHILAISAASRSRNSAGAGPTTSRM